MATLTWKVLLVAPDTPIRDLSKSKKANRGDRVFNTTITGAAFTSLAVDYRDFSILELVSKAIRGHSAGGSPAETRSFFISPS